MRRGAGGELGVEAGGRGRQRERAGLDLERLVKDIRARVKETRQFWARLPYQTCNADPFITTTKLNETCWNGQAVGRYVLTRSCLPAFHNQPALSII